MEAGYVDLVETYVRILREWKIVIRKFFQYYAFDKIFDVSIQYLEILITHHFYV